MSIYRDCAYYYKDFCGPRPRSAPRLFTGLVFARISVRALVVNYPNSKGSAFTHHCTRVAGLPLMCLSVLFRLPSHAAIPGRMFSRQLVRMLGNRSSVVSNGCHQAVRVHLPCTRQMFFFSLPARIYIRNVAGHIKAHHPSVP